jgi:putative toxin-antitoxin system antitoxin component (TIGR02293 family)
MADFKGFSEAPVQWMGEIRQGLPVELVDGVLADGRLTAAELDRLALPRKTLAHRRTLGRLTPEQSDRLVRILRVIEQAERAFGDVAKARIWLRRPTAALADHAPLDLLDTDIGSREVENLLGRIEHGIAA